MIYRVFGKKYGNVRKDRTKICEELGIKDSQIVFTEQTHSDKILVVNEPGNYSDRPEDAMITDKDGIYLMIKAADCQAVCIYDYVNQVVAAVHNGWKGSVQNIVGKTIAKLVDEYECNPEDLIVDISPSLGPCHAEFSDPYKELPKEFHKYIDDKNHVDFWQATQDQLVEAGVDLVNIKNPRICTVCNKDEYFSYRVEGENYGRNGIIIAL